MRATKSMLTAGIGGVLLMAAAACGGSSSGGQTASTGGQSPGASGGGVAQHPSALVGDVGKNDAFSISLTDPSGKTITHLAAGTYKLTVHDFSGIHNFHLMGDGVSEATTVPEKTTKTFTVTFKRGSYSFQCDPHASQMHGSFTVS
ncbi:MAG TPA: plastocyanin/azurin family copper-binding protein [Mycobacteriales bacterium]|nr:plastocyanin/azurin family copper-binding protein [Mycobacteriales bacterium]